LICAIRVKSFWDINNATLGILYSLIGAAVFQVFCKWLIGGLRPHFLSVCQPDPERVRAGMGEGFTQAYFRPDICTGDIKKIRDSLESWPSGHTTAAFAGFVFLSLYLNAKLKVFSTYHPALWKLIAVYAPILGATLIGGALTIDEFHNWYDVLAGGIIGTCTALVAYRMTFASVWDFRFNHIRLPRTTSLFLRKSTHLNSSAASTVSPIFRYSPGGQIGELSSSELPFSREGGWGWGIGEGAGGAPFDATAMGAAGPGGSGGGMSGMGGGALGRAEAGLNGHNGTTSGHGLNGARRV